LPIMATRVRTASGEDNGGVSADVTNVIGV